MAFGKRRYLDKETYLEHAVMSEEENGTARFVETATRIEESQRHGRCPVSVSLLEAFMALTFHPDSRHGTCAYKALSRRYR